MLRFSSPGLETSISVKEHTMTLAEIEEKYKSPICKLFPFFERSRDGWKEKCTAAKSMIKHLKQQVSRLEQGRERWKGIAKTQAREIEQLRRELDAQKT
jgi:hypothetical protein